MCAAVEAMYDDPDAVVNDAGEASDIVTASFEAAQLFRDDGLQREFVPSAALRAMPGLREQRKQRQFCDVVFRSTDGAEIWAHRFVMYARYSGCYELFTEARQNLTPEQENDIRTPPIRALVTDLEGDMVQLLVDFAYHVPLSERIDQHNVVKVLDLAETLKLHWIRDHCLRTLKENLEPESCIGTNRLACRLGYEKLAREAYRYLLRNFTEVWKHSADFEKLTPEQMRTILEDNGLCAPSEVEDVFNAIIRWISADSAERKGYLAKFLPLLRFVRCTDTEFDRVVTHPQVHGDGDSLEVLTVIHKTLTRRWMAVGEVAGVDLSPKLWLVPRLPKDILFLLGGRIMDAGYTKNMLTYNNRAHQWRLIDNPLTIPRSPLRAAVIDKRIYIVGGYSSFTSCDTVWCFDVTLATWSAKASMAYKRSWHSVVALKGYIYAMGGFDLSVTECTSKVERYDVGADRWTMVAQMNEPRTKAGAAAACGRIYIAGGHTERACLDSVECYDPSTNAWTRVANLSSPRASVSVVGHMHMLYIIGGYDDHAVVSTVEQLDVRKSRLSDLPSLPYAKSQIAAAVLDGCIYTVGGHNGTGPVPYVERYDIAERKWYTATPLDTGCADAIACVVQDVDDPASWI